MMSNKMISLVLLVLCGGVLFENHVDACSCLPSHPQEKYCTADFVIVARIRKEFTTSQNKIYKAKIRKEFKMSEKAKLALKSGRLMTALDGAMCGSELEVGKVYLLTGSVQGLQAHINLCGFVKQWKDVTGRQRKGFRLIYGRGCGCKISYFYHNKVMKDRCAWNHYTCQAKYGICLRSPKGQCHWSKSIDLKRCITGEFDSEVTKQTTTISGTLYPEPNREKEKNMAANRGKYYYKAKKSEDIIKTS